VVALAVVHRNADDPRRESWSRNSDGQGTRLWAWTVTGLSALAGSKCAFYFSWPILLRVAPQGAKPCGKVLTKQV